MTALRSPGQHPTLCCDLLQAENMQERLRIEKTVSRKFKVRCTN